MKKLVIKNTNKEVKIGDRITYNTTYSLRLLSIPTKVTVTVKEGTIPSLIKEGIIEEINY